ncbi:MAG: tetratricopeptide repeat protein [Pseudomonadota bacterium]
MFRLSNAAAMAAPIVEPIVTPTSFCARALGVLLLIGSGAVAAETLPDVPEGAQAVSLTGEALFPGTPNEAVASNLAEARGTYERDPDDADKIIWYGRRKAYTGDYRGAIETFSEGIEKFPEDARLYRHRGHRYITIREFDRAIADLERAATLIEGTENETEPDGAPNALGIPVSSLHGNIWYHLGLAYYLKHDWPNALRAYDAGFAAGRNDDNRVSTTHWRYMILRRMGRVEEAAAVLDVIREDMEIIENMSYHSLCLFYKGLLSFDELVSGNEDSPAGAAVLYGAANWQLYAGDAEEGYAMMEALTSTASWAGFGFIAAEADLAAR